MAETRVHLIISGRVQGVSFRYATRREAEHLGVTGWVRNLPDGNVEAVVEGEESKVDELTAWCHQGPPAARVDRVDIRREPYEGKFKRFEITF